jgi:type II secretory pathway pseudopilin PulG
MSDELAKPTFDELYAQVTELDRKRRHRDRRFYYTWVAIALLAIISSTAIILAQRASNQVTKEVQATATHAVEQNDQIVAYMRGEQGIPGVPGSNGQDGSPGLPGSTGTPGATGPPGPKGPTGSAGDTGPAGGIGPSGANGEVGTPGTNGQTGPVGVAGSNGATGEKGDTGAKGNTGKEGAAGTVGPIGPAGPTGPQGVQGPPGPVGATGVAGPSQPITIQTVSAASPNDVSQDKSVTATCPAGSVLLAGGYHWTPATPGITAIADEPDAANGWHVEAIPDTFPGNSLWQLTVYALCNIPSAAPR